MLNVLQDDAPIKTVTERPNSYNRRLSDKILNAFHQACDEHDLEVARQLLKTLEVVVYAQRLPPERNRRKQVENLVGAHHRLWNLRNS